MVKPRRRAYVHRDLITVVNACGLTEHGEVVTNLAVFAASSDAHIWITVDPAGLLLIMMHRLTHIPEFNYQMTNTRDDEGGLTMSHTKLQRFGFRPDPTVTDKDDARAQLHAHGLNGKNQAMHTVWSPADMMRNPADLIDGASHSELMRFGQDVRDWCKDNNIPLPTSLSGIASSLLRDSRFWPHDRGRVPKSTNERIRSHLPGVYSELRVKPSRRHQAIALDQRRAYHVAAQEVPMPDPTTLFARGYFHDPENSPIWAQPGGVLYNRIIRQPGIVAVRAMCRVTLKDETRPPAVNFQGTDVIYLWTNELDLCQRHGVHVHGIIAAWTSTTADSGMPRYGAWSQSQIDQASDYRARWLKPTLHATYGLLAARSRTLRIGHRHGKGQPAVYILGHGHEFPVKEVTLPDVAPATVNVTALGTLQAEIRQRSMKLANALMAEGVTVLHIHADGIHVEGRMPLLDTRGWSVEPRDNLQYIDRVSWISDHGDCLPGRDTAQRIELRRHLVDTLVRRKV